MAAASGALWIPGVLAIALMCFGGAIFYNQASNPTQRPDIAAAVATLAAGTETTCTFAQDTTQPPRCRVENEASEYVANEVLCFCPATVRTAEAIAAAASGLAVAEPITSVEVFLGPSTDMSLSTGPAQQSWCDAQLAPTTGTAPGWRNVLTFDDTSRFSWSCNVIMTTAGEPCPTVIDQLYEDAAGNADCIANMLHGTFRAGHYACLEDIVSGTAVPCVRNPDGRLMVGTKARLQAQFGLHEDHYEEQDLWMSSIASGMFFSGIAILVITLLCCAGQIMMPGSDDRSLKRRVNEEWSQDCSEDLSE